MFLESGILPSPFFRESPVWIPAPATGGLVAHTVVTGGVNGATTSGIDTTGATLIVVGVHYFSGSGAPTISDSKSNTWTALTSHASGSGGASLFYYCINPTVGSGHTFTSSGTNIFSPVVVAAFNKSSAAFDVENGGTVPDGNTDISTGSVTPTADNSILVALVGFLADGKSASIDSGFTITDQTTSVAGTSYGIALAWLQQGSASAVNPQWTISGVATNLAASIASFK